MTAAEGRKIVSEQTWPDGHEVDDLEGLLRVFACDDPADLEDPLAGTLPEDPGNVNINADDHDSINIITAGVPMWSLCYPISARQFDDYLFELDERMTLQKILWELPDVQSWEADGEPSIVPMLAELLKSTTEEFSAARGDDWRPLDLDWVGSGSNPSNYLWTGRYVVGLDNSNAYLYGSTTGDTSLAFDLDADAFEEVRWAVEIWRDSGPSLDWFTQFVLG